MQQVRPLISDVTFVGVALCVVVTVLTVGCLRCRKKLTEEEKQQKYFERFRKSHMRRQKHRVDIIRHASNEGESTTSVGDMHTDFEHSYETLNGQIPAILVATPSSSGGYSFFDDSFQTVIEASSCNQTNNSTFPGNYSGQQLIPVVNKMASYLTLHPDSSTSHLCNSSSTCKCCQGAVNEAFVNSKMSVDSDSSHYSSTSSSNNESSLDYQSTSYPSDSHNYSNQSVTIEQESDRVENQTESDIVSNIRAVETQIENTDIKVVYANDEREANEILDADAVHYANIKLTERDHSVLSNLSRIDESSKHTEKVKDKNLQKLLMEGPTRHYVSKQHCLHTVATCLDCGKIPSSLVMPKLPGSRSKKSILGCTISGASDHTYESLTQDLYQDYNKRDSICSRYDTSDLSFDEFNTPLSHKILNLRRQSLEQGQTELETDKAPKISDHTYDSLKFSTSSGDSGKVSTASTGVVIIGRTISHPYDAVNTSESHERSFHEPPGMINRLIFTDKKARKESDDRYSPFPSTKKLAIKSTLKNVGSSPRFVVVPTVSQNVPHFASSRRNTSIDKMADDPFDIKTPEIVVENIPKCFDLDATVFVSPKRNFISRLRRKSFGKTNEELPSISPLCTYETMKTCTNLKYSCVAKEYGKYEEKGHSKSLPSLPDDLELELREHCEQVKSGHVVSTPIDPHSGL